MAEAPPIRNKLAANSPVRVHAFSKSAAVSPPGLAAFCHVLRVSGSPKSKGEVMDFDVYVPEQGVKAACASEPNR